MVRQFDEMSRTIGNIEGCLRAIQGEMKDGIRDLNKKVDEVVKNMHSLPPSPTCLQKHDELGKEINAIKTQGAKHLGFASGLAVSASVALQWVLGQFGIHLSGK